MQATIIVKANATTNSLVQNIATMAQDLASCPYFKGGCSLPYVEGYYGQDDYWKGNVLKFNHFYYMSEKGNEVEFKKIKNSLNKVFWEIKLDCTRGWLVNHQLGNLITESFQDIPQTIVKFESQEKERGVWDKEYRNAKFKFKNGFIHLTTTRWGVVVDSCWKALLRRNNISVKAEVVY